MVDPAYHVDFGAGISLLCAACFASRVRSMGTYDHEREDQHYHPLHEHDSNYRVVGPRVKEDHPCSICRVVHFMKTGVTIDGTKVDFVFNVGDQEEHICRDLGVQISAIPTIDYGCTYCLEYF